MLTDTQRQLAADNHNLIYAFLHKRNLSVDDYYDIAVIGLCKAARHFDPGRGLAFSTFAYRCMDGELWMTAKNAKAKGRSGYISVSLDAALTDKADSGTLSDILADTRYSPEDLAVCNDLLSAVADQDPRIRIICELKAAGYTQPQIAAHLGLSQAHVSRLLAKARKIIA